MTVSISPACVFFHTTHGQSYSFNFRAFNHSIDPQAQDPGKYYIEVRLWSDSTHSTLQTEGAAADYSITPEAKGGIVHFHQPLPQGTKLVSIASALAPFQPIHISPDAPVKGDNLNIVADYAAMRLKEHDCLFERAILTSAVNEQTKTYEKIVIDEWKDGEILSFSGDSTHKTISGAGITLGGLQLIQTNVTADAAKALASMQTAQQYATSAQAQSALANTAAANAQSAQQASQQSQIDALKAQQAAELAKQATDSNLQQSNQAKQDTDQIKQDAEQIKTDMQTMISKYPDPATAADNDIVRVEAGATTADNKFITESLPDFWAKVWNPKDYDIFQYLQGSFRLVQSFRMDTTSAQDGYVPYLFQNVNGEIVLRFRAAASSGSGSSTGGVAIDFTGEPDGTGIASIGGAVKHVPVVWLKSSDASQSYDGTLDMPSSPPADGTIYVLQIKYDATNNKYIAELKEGGSFFGIDPKTIPSGWTFDGMITLPQTLIDGCHTPKFCIDSAARTIKLDYNVGGNSVNDTVGVIKPVKDGQVPMSGTDSTGARVFNKLYDLPLPSPTASDIGKTLAWTAQGWQFVDMAKLDEATKELIAGNLVQGFPQFTLAGAGSVQIPDIHIFYTDGSGVKQEKDLTAQTISVDAAAQELQYIYYNPATDSIEVDKTPPTLALQKSRVYLARYDAGSDVVSPYYFSTQGLQETLRTIMRETEGVKDAVITGVGGKVRVQQDNVDAYAVAYHQNPTNNTNHNVIPLSTGEMTLHFISTAGGNESTTQDWEFKYDDSGTLTDLPSNNAAFYRIYADALGKYYVLRPTSVYNNFADALNHFSEGTRSFPPPPSTHGHLQLLATVLVHEGATDFGNKSDFMIYSAGISGSNTTPTTASNLPLGGTGTHYYQSDGSNIQLVDSPVDLTHVKNGEVLQRKLDGTLGSVPVAQIAPYDNALRVILIEVSWVSVSPSYGIGSIVKIVNGDQQEFTLNNHVVTWAHTPPPGKKVYGVNVLAAARDAVVYLTDIQISGDVNVQFAGRQDTRNNNTPPNTTILLTFSEV